MASMEVLRLGELKVGLANEAGAAVGEETAGMGPVGDPYPLLGVEPAS